MLRGKRPAERAANHCRQHKPDTIHPNFHANYFPEKRTRLPAPADPRAKRREPAANPKPREDLQPNNPPACDPSRFTG
jgi:hypothetical protein